MINQILSASEIHVKNANQFILAKKYAEAANSYIKASNLYIELDLKYRAAATFIKAAEAFSKYENIESILTFKRAIELFLIEDKFNSAAGAQKRISEILLKDNNIDESILSYVKAGNIYEACNCSSNSNECFSKAAYLYIDREKYQNALDILNKIGTSYLYNDLIKFRAKSTFFDLCLCYLALGDIIKFENIVSKYFNMEDNLNNSLGSNLLWNIKTAIRKSDIEDFNNLIAEYNAISPLEMWQMKIFQNVKIK
jgi:alpha-soluble NSF attachment protein